LFGRFNPDMDNAVYFQKRTKKLQNYITDYLWATQYGSALFDRILDTEPKKVIWNFWNGMEKTRKIHFCMISTKADKLRAKAIGKSRYVTTYKQLLEWVWEKHPIILLRPPLAVSKKNG